MTFIRSPQCQWKDLNEMVNMSDISTKTGINKENKRKHDREPYFIWYTVYVTRACAHTQSHIFHTHVVMHIRGRNYAKMMCTDNNPHSQHHSHWLLGDAKNRINNNGIDMSLLPAVFQSQYQKGENFKLSTFNMCTKVGCELVITSLHLYIYILKLSLYNFICDFLNFEFEFEFFVHIELYSF